MDDSPVILLTCLDQSGIRFLNHLLQLFQALRQKHTKTAQYGPLPEPVEVIGHHKRSLKIYSCIKSV